MCLCVYICICIYICIYMHLTRGFVSVCRADTTATARQLYRSISIYICIYI